MAASPLAASVRRRLSGLALVACVLTGAWGCTPAAPPAEEAPASAPSIDGEALLADVRTLADPAMAGRGAGTEGGLKARAWILDRVRAIGLEPLGDDYLLPFQFPARPDGVTTDGANIAARCAGTRADAPAFVVTAHYDHLGVRNDEVYHGADDNASGVAVLLALAAECRRAPFAHTAIFVWFDAEEHGLQGARAFVEAPPVPRETLALNVNLDMVSRGDRGELYVAGTHHYPALRAPLDEVAARAPLTLLFGHDRPEDGANDWTMQSDHGPFHERGIPFVYFGVEDHPDYHRPTDTPEKIDPVFFGRAATTILDAIRTLDQALLSR
ncbi:MAG: M28 family peptidase [Vicinamibacteria bacterium]